MGLFDDANSSAQDVVDKIKDAVNALQNEIQQRADKAKADITDTTNAANSDIKLKVEELQRHIDELKR